MRELTQRELNAVAGGLEQSTVISTQTALITMGVATRSAMLGAGVALSGTGVGIFAGLTLVSLALTGAYAYQELC